MHAEVETGESRRENAHESRRLVARRYDTGCAGSGRRSGTRRNAFVPALLSLALGAACIALSAAAQELAPTKPSMARPLLDNPAADWGAALTNWIELSAGGLIVDGSKAEVQRRYQLPARAFGGVEDFHYEGPAGSNGVLQVDGRAIYDNHDYLVRIGWLDPNTGFARMGYREFRTWYDRHGGFLPQGGGVWVTPFDRGGAVDRGEAWIELGLTKPDIPKVTFRYAHEFRDGTKDSTIWGDYNLNIGTTNAANLRDIVPSYYRIDEERDTFELDVAHGAGDTDFGLGVRYEIISEDDKRFMVRRPGELPPLVTPGSERAITQRDKVDIDLFNAHAFTETRFSEKVLFTTGYSFTTLDSDAGGSRIYGPAFDAVYDPTFARRQAFDEGFLGLRGGSTVDQYVLTLNLFATLAEHFSIIPSVRIEKYDEDGTTHFTETTVGPPPGLAAIEEDLRASNDYCYIDVAESLELRSANLRHWLIYARGDWSQSDGRLQETELDLATDERVLFRDTDSLRLTQKYSIGATWYPLARLSLAAQYYHKIHDNDYDHDRDSTTNAPPSGDRYPAYITGQDFETDDVNFRVTVRPWTVLTLVTRYDFQLSRIDTAVPVLGEVQSAEMTSHIISETASWTPMPRLNLQGSFNYALDVTETPADSLFGPLLQKAVNDYWNASVLAAFALNEKTDLQTQVTYYRARNYADNSAVTVPYNKSSEETAVTATLIRQLTDRLRWTLKYGYFTNNDGTYGGHKDYQAHLVYSSMQYRF